MEHIYISAVDCPVNHSKSTGYGPPNFGCRLDYHHWLDGSSMAANPRKPLDRREWSVKFLKCVQLSWLSPVTVQLFIPYKFWFVYINTVCSAKCREKINPASEEKNWTTWRTYISVYILIQFINVEYAGFFL